jgi:hypothetical protein
MVERISGCWGTAAKRMGILQLRNDVRFANAISPFRMTRFRNLLRMAVLFAAACAPVFGTTYYVSSSSGSDSNSGTSTTAAWETIAHVNGQTFLPGDSILFKRGDVWNESLSTASSGSSGNPITFDAYGAGAAPNLTGYYAVPATSWVKVTGNAWKAPVPSSYTTINFCLFGSIWGQKVAASTSNLTAQWDFYLASGYVYVFAFTPNTSSYGLILPQSSSSIATSCIVLRSTADSSLPAGRVVGTHGIQDNLATSTDILIRNPDATGQNMYFAVGPTWTCTSSPCNSGNQAMLGGITTVSANTTTLCSIPQVGSTTLCPNTGTSGNVLVPLANGYVSSTLGGSSSSVVTISGGGNTETFTPQSCPNQTGVCINLSALAHAYPAGACIVYNTTGCGGAVTNGTSPFPFTLANGTVTNTLAYNDLQYMWTMQSEQNGSGVGEQALNGCNASSTASAPTCTADRGPDHWLIEDAEIRMFPGNTGNQNLATFNGVTTISNSTGDTSKMAQGIHFDRDWLHGDWTSVAVGSNSISDMLDAEIISWSFMNSMISQGLRPGGEHHGIYSTRAAAKDRSQCDRGRLDSNLRRRL